MRIVKIGVAHNNCLATRNSKSKKPYIQGNYYTGKDEIIVEFEHVDGTTYKLCGTKLQWERVIKIIKTL